MRVLILGGTTEATALAQRLSTRADIDAILSFAGRTERPVPPPIPFRIGGFGGVEALCEFLRTERIDAVVDATHPFAIRMSQNAREACARASVPLAMFSRPAWSCQDGDQWICVSNVEAAVRALGDAPRRVFLTHGRLHLAAFAQAPQHTYVVRTIDRPADIKALPKHRLILARGPFAKAEELRLMREEGIEIVVTKNSGGRSTYGKIEAARELNIPVVVIERPRDDSAAALFDIDDVLSWIQAHRPSP